MGSLGAMALGGVAVGVDPSWGPERLASVAVHCEATVALVEGPSMLASAWPALARAPSVRHLVLMDAAAQRARGVSSFAELVELGSRGDEADFYSALEAVKGGDPAQLVYGEEPQLEAVTLTHHNLAWTASQLALTYGVGEDDVLMCCASLSKASAQVVSVHLPLLAGAQTSFGQGAAQVMDDLAEVRPTLFFASPEVWGLIDARAEALAGAPGSLHGLLVRARPVARRIHLEAQGHQPSGLGLQGQYALARRLVLGPLKERLGLDRGRLLATLGRLAQRETFERLASLDVVVSELYGQAAATGVISLNAPGAAKFGSQGRPMLGIEVRVAPDGEVLVRGANVCAGSFKDAPREAELLRGGWLHTGDRGALDEEGFLSISEERSGSAR